MKRGLSHTLALVGFGLAMFAAIPAWAQTTAPGPYYATPSWDQKLTTSRFVILANWNNEAVLDRETGLVWERSPDTTVVNWNDAQLICNNRSVDGRKGWRLPGVQELASLMDPTVAFPGPALPAGHPFLNVQSSHYWSATTLAVGAPVGATLAWVVHFNLTFVAGFDKSNTGYIWCVRGGQGPDPQ